MQPKNKSSLSSSIRKWERRNDDQLEGSSLPFFKDLHLRAWQWIPALICMGRTSRVPRPLTWVPPGAESHHGSSESEHPGWDPGNCTHSSDRSACLLSGALVWHSGLVRTAGLDRLAIISCDLPKLFEVSSPSLANGYHRFCPALPTGKLIFSENSLHRDKSLALQRV